MKKNDKMEAYKKEAFTAHNFLEVEFTEQDAAGYRLTVRPESKNIGGTIHGGVLFTMADNAAGVAAETDGRTYVTQSSSFYFLRNQAEGSVRAVSRVRHRGRRTCLVDVDVTNENGQLLATGEFTFFCVDESGKETQNKR